MNKETERAILDKPASAAGSDERDSAAGVRSEIVRAATQPGVSLADFWATVTGVIERLKLQEGA